MPAIPNCEPGYPQELSTDFDEGYPQGCEFSHVLNRARPNALARTRWPARAGPHAQGWKHLKHAQEKPILLHARGLTFTYPGASRPAFGPLDFDLAPGEIVLLLGPSGCGKSTFALCCNGLIPHLLDGDLEGELTVEGQDVRTASVPRLAERVGLVFQDPESQICALTLEDEVAFGPENLRLPTAELDARIENALNRAGLILPRSTSTRALSGGQKQRLALAGVLALEPRLLVLDEPTAHLDPLGARAFFEQLDRLRNETGIGVLLIEHRVDEVADLVDRVAVMDEAGKLRHVGPPGEVFRQLSEEAAIWIPESAELALRLEAIEKGGMPGPPVEADAGITEALPLTPVNLAHWMTGRNEGRTPPVPSSEALLVKREGKDSNGTLLVAEGVSYRYSEGPPALRSAHLKLRRGEIHALVGPNGSGKSTLALIVAGLIPPSSGHMTVNPEKVASTPPPGRTLFSRFSRSSLRPADVPLRIGYVFQNPEHQFIAQTVEEELAFSLARQPLSSEEIARRVNRMLERFRLEGYARQHPYRLSGGQKRRLSVATMLMDEPELLILDEPTFGQDRQSARALLDELRRLNEGGLTLLVITHDMRLVAETAHRVTGLKGGETRFQGTPRDLFSQPELLDELALLPPPMAQLAVELRKQGVDAPLFLTQEDALDWMNHRSE